MYDMAGGAAMSTGSLKSEVVYVRNLVEAGVDGVTTAWKADVDRSFTPALTSALWPAAVGGGIGVLSICLASSRPRGEHRVATGGLIGTALGFGVGVVWASRVFTRTIVRSAHRKINDVRDARWLEKNPINYA
jgi:hypothetical protein